MKIATKLAICGGVALSSTTSSVQAFVPTTPAGTKSTTSSALNFFGGGSASKSDLDEEVRVGRRWYLCWFFCVGLPWSSSVLIDELLLAATNIFAISPDITFICTWRSTNAHIISSQNTSVYHSGRGSRNCWNCVRHLRRKGRNTSNRYVWLYGDMNIRLILHTYCTHSYLFYYVLIDCYTLFNIK